MLALISHHYANITCVDILQGLSYFASEAICHFPFSSLPIFHNLLVRDGSFEAALDPTQAEGKTMLHVSQLLQHACRSNAPYATHTFSLSSLR